jgi:hypothetical protein
VERVEISKNIEKAVELLPKSGQEVSVKDLRNGLKSYGINDLDATAAIKEMGINDRRIKSRRNSYLKTKTLDDIMIRRTDNY